MIRKLRSKFIRIAMLSVGLVLMLLITAVNVANGLYVHAEVEHQLDSLLEGKVAGSKEEKQSKGKESGRKNNPEAPFQMRYFVFRFDDQGNVLRTNLEHIASVSEDTLTPYLQIAREKDAGYYDGFRFRVTQTPGGFHVAVFLNCEKEFDSVRSVLTLSLCMGAGCMGLVYLLIVAFSRKAIDPIVKNAEKQKQFITDASHELKTPLTVMTTSLKVLEMDVGKQKWIDKTQAQVEHMRALVEEMVALARLDEENPPVSFGRFCVSEALEDTCESFRQAIAEGGRQLCLEIPADLEFCGDAMLVCRLVSILLDNSVKYTPTGGTVSLTLEKTKKGIRIRQENTCESIAQEELGKLFDRFYRLDKARAKSTGGFGIGLSIAQSIAQLHGGSIEASLPEENRIRFTVELSNTDQ